VFALLSPLFKNGRETCLFQGALNEMPEGPEIDRVEIPIEDTIDLHSFQPRDIPGVVEEYLYQAVKKGFNQVRIIHGRGIGVQRAIIHSILKRHPQVIGFRDMPDRGSTVVDLVASKDER
jgi:dsDNA-specific endonuclease/ATPase MutS2